jgi:hypothetical protein
MALPESLLEKRKDARNEVDGTDAELLSFRDVRSVPIQAQLPVELGAERNGHVRHYKVNMRGQYALASDGACTAMATSAAVYFLSQSQWAHRERQGGVRQSYRVKNDGDFTFLEYFGRILYFGELYKQERDKYQENKRVWVKSLGSVNPRNVLDQAMEQLPFPQQYGPIMERLINVLSDSRFAGLVPPLSVHGRLQARCRVEPPLPYPFFDATSERFLPPILLDKDVVITRPLEQPYLPARIESSELSVDISFKLDSRTGSPLQDPNWPKRLTDRFYDELILRSVRRLLPRDVWQNQHADAVFQRYLLPFGLWQVNMFFATLLGLPIDFEHPERYATVGDWIPGVVAASGREEPDTVLVNPPPTSAQEDVDQPSFAPSSSSSRPSQADEIAVNFRRLVTQLQATPFGGASFLDAQLFGAGEDKRQQRDRARQILLRMVRQLDEADRAPLPVPLLPRTSPVVQRRPASFQTIPSLLRPEDDPAVQRQERIMRQTEITMALREAFARSYRANPLSVLKEEVLDVTTSTLGYADRSPLEPWRHSIKAANRAFITDFAASLLESPLLRLPVQAQRRDDPGMKLPDKFVHVPFALVFSRIQSRSSCLFKDGFIDSPWVYFDSHTSPFVTVVEFDSVEDFYGSGLDDPSPVTIELYVASTDLEAMQPAQPDMQGYLRAVLALPPGISASTFAIH